MSESISTNMICPKCGTFQQKADTCTACGIVVAKIRGDRDRMQGKAEPSAAAATQCAPSLGDRELHEERTMTQVVAIVIGVVVCVFGYLVSTPVEMRLDEFVEAKKQSFHLRNFKIEAMVAPDPHESFLEAQSSDGQRLSSLKLAANNTTGYVTFDPRDLERELNEGDLVQVTGRFDRVPYYDGRRQFKKITMAFARSIKVIKPAF